MNYTRPRGTVDLFGSASVEFGMLEEILRYIAFQYNLSEIKTPIFESRDLFTKAVGETSDIVHKEFYDFQDKGERWIVLRPEGTAGTIRAIVENKLLANTIAPLKVFYMGPFFRYERPQSGRQRQFHQFGIEFVGDIKLTDEVECVCIAQTALDACRISNYTLEINNIGDFKSRAKWIDELKKYFEKYKADLTEDSLARLATNPLRILDDKVDGAKDFVKSAPRINEFLSAEQKQYFEKIKYLLTKLGIDYVVNENLVRGLDYYNGLIFEFVSKSNILKGQSTLIGGGRYDSLVKMTGGPDVSGFGFGLGMERIIIATKDENKDFFKTKILDIVIAPLSEVATETALLINRLLRNMGLKVGMHHGVTKLEKHFKYADKNPSRYIIILGDEELKNKTVKIKNQITKKENIVPILELEKFFGNEENE